MMETLAQKDKRLKILFIPAWYPSEVNPIEGVFVKEHARAASIYNEIVVIYAYPDPLPRPGRLYQISDGIEDGIRTIRIKYQDYDRIFACVKKLIFKRRKPNEAPTPSATNKLITILKKPLRILKDLLYYWSTFAAFRRLVNEGWKPDIIHAHIFTAGVPAIILGKLYKIRVIITEQYSIFPLRKLAFYERVKARFAMNKAQMILPVSTALKEAIEAYAIKNEFQVVPNIVDTEIFYSPFGKKQREDRKRILMVAILSPVKGVPYLLRALAQVKEKRSDFILDILGDGANRHEYEKLAGELELENMVNFHGLKTKKEVAEFMRNCDFFILPSLYETFGTVIVEALASGKPVVASDIGGIKEIINENLGILVPVGDIKKLQQAIEFMLDNYVRYSPQELSAYARGKFNHESVGRLLNNTYAKVKEKRR
ncbi:glycosyltransferase [Chloroflexota bacterium]